MFADGVRPPKRLKQFVPAVGLKINSINADGILLFQENDGPAAIRVE